MKDIQEDIIHFWFEETQPSQWFQVNPEFDALTKEKYEDAYNSAAAGQFDDWQKNADGALALCILLDQMPRNMFRGTPKAFATDKKALVAAKFAISKGLDQVLPVVKRRFLYLPFEHSEVLSDQVRCVELFEKIKDEDKLGHDYALRHLQVVEKYGRFPHRNKILGRENTPEEEEYLAQPGAGF
ncbi:MAG: DUF924 domain-containing protein [Alphaproteobacteria bacterium]|nr:DUF924 domain-containing protein [Alphaproteobacteria bacterium]